MESNIMNKMELWLDFIDLFVKRLVTPSALVIAAAFINSHEKPFILINTAMFSLIAIAVIYTTISVGVISQKVNGVVTNKVMNKIFVIFSALLYLVLFVVAVKTGISKF
jgi:hypothetical protein